MDDAKKKEMIVEVLKYVNVEGLIADLLLEKIVYGRIDELVASSENMLDDGLAAILKPQLKALLVKYLAEKKAELLG